MVNTPEGLLEFFKMQPASHKAWKLYIGEKNDATKISGLSVMGQSFDDVHHTKEAAAEHLANQLSLINEPGKYTLQVKPTSNSSTDALTCILHYNPYGVPQRGMNMGIGNFQHPAMQQQQTSIPRGYFSQSEVDAIVAKEKSHWEEKKRHSEQIRKLQDAIEEVKREKKNVKGDLLGQVSGFLKQLGLEKQVGEAISGLVAQKQQGTRVAVAGFDGDTAVPPATPIEEETITEAEQAHYEQMNEKSFEQLDVLTGGRIQTIELLADLAAWGTDNPAMFDSILQSVIKGYRAKNG